MPSLRLFILWIVCVCVPLQGYAASTMALCDAIHAGDDGGAAVHAMHGMAAAADGGGEDEGEGARRFDRARESHGSQADDQGTPPGHDAHARHDAHAGHDARADAPAEGTHDGVAADASPADASHACGTCAVCHASALTGGFDVAVLHELPPADLAEPALAPATRVPRVLDRPPRA